MVPPRIPGEFMSDPEVKTALGLDAFDTTAAAGEGAVMEVRSPASGEVMRWPDGRPWTVTYYGADSEKIAKVARIQNDRRSAAMIRTRQPATSAVVEKDNIEILVTATKEWDIPLADGSAAKNNANEYRSAYAKYKWLFEQGNEFIGNRGNFLKA
jgi:hypothetical protein